jgi:hypothetical protein
MNGAQALLEEVSFDGSLFECNATELAYGARTIKIALGGALFYDPYRLREMLTAKRDDGP